ncbi:hypothetical protein OBBRIDRAFT_793436 [Obba rivulosa]|uniref:ARID domain-containing protein n=1 Tax=Obba rivulosa TaxID=1052685 RepID=A0A8E2AY54_9APHY|nr:hypothetical protein OBBRIDRAFT_793436 [Obba rivulosa]
MSQQMTANGVSSSGFPDQGQMQQGLQQFAGNQNTARLQALAAANNNPAMMQALQNPGTAISRQLELLIQQPQHSGPAPNPMAAIRQHQQHQQQHQQQQHQQHQQQAQQQSQGLNMSSQLGQMQNQVPQTSFFPASTMQGGADANHQVPRQMMQPNSMLNAGAQRSMVQPPPMQQGIPQQQPPHPQQPQQQGQRILPDDFRKRVEGLKNQMSDYEKKISFLKLDPTSKQMNSPIAIQIKTLMDEITKRKYALHQMALQMAHGQKAQESGNAMGGGMPGGMGGAPSIPHAAAGPSNLQLQRPIGVGMNQGQPNWPAQQGLAPPFQQAQPQQQQPEQFQHTPQIPQKVATPQLMPQVTAQMGSLPQRTVSTPLQIAQSNPQNQPQASPNVMAVQFASQTGPVQQAPMRFPPLTQDMFNQAYRNWCTRNNFTPDPSQLNRDGRQINLYVLHQEVMNMGTYGRIANNDDAWAILGGKLGFVQFPASSESEPAKSGPGMAAHLHHVYKEYLHGFDAAYITSILRRRQEQQQEQQQRAQGAQPPSMQNTAQNGDQERRMQMMSQMQNAPMSGLPQNALMPGPSTQPINAHQVMPMQRPGAGAEPKQEANGMNGLPNLPGMDPARLDEFIKYAMIPAPELRAHGIPEVVINWIESHRPMLQRTWQQQQDFRGGVTKAQAAGGNGQRPASTLPPQLFNPGAQANQGGMSSAIPAGLNMRVDQPQLRSWRTVQIPPIQQRRRPTAQEEQQGADLVAHIKSESMGRIGAMRMYNIPDHQRFEFNTLFEQAYKFSQEIEPSLHRFACFWKPEAIRHIVTMVLATKHQKHLLTMTPPRYCLEVHTVRTMAKHFQTALEQFNGITASLYPENGQPILSAPPATVQQHQRIPSVPQLPPQVAPQPTPQLPQVQPPQAPSIPQAPVAIASSPQMPPPATGKRKHPHDANVPVSTPPASASTPAANAPTPTHLMSSPQTPKSLKMRAHAETKAPPKPHKPSAKATPVAGPSTEQAATPATPKTPATPAAVATPAPAPTPTPETGSKRQREEEPVSYVASLEPSPKKIKTEWDGPSDDALLKKQEQIDHIETEEDAAKFISQMSDLIKQAEAEENSDLLTTQISDTLEQILKGFSIPSDGVEDSLSSLTGPGPSDFSSMFGGPSSPPPSLPGLDGSEYFDFSSFTGIEDDAGSKAVTPDLVQTSSTNPSPSSQSEADPGHAPSTAADTAKIMDPKVEEGGQGLDFLRGSLFDQIDGGESAYYNASDGWKWDTPMAPLDQAWAISS